MKKRIIASALALLLTLAPALSASALGGGSIRNGQLTCGLEAEDALLVTDIYNRVIWRVSGENASIFAGVVPAADASGEPVPVYRDGKANQAFFEEPWAIVPFLRGYAVSDAQAHTLRYVENGHVTTLTGTQDKAGHKDGDAETALFDRPTGLAVGGDGTLYVADTGNGAIRLVSTDGKVSTLVEGLTAPTGLCWYRGTLYVAETGRSRVCCVENGHLRVLAGASQEAEEPGEYYGGYTDGPALRARFDHPQGVAVDENGVVFVADTGNSAVRIIRDERVYTLRRGDVRKDGALASPCGILTRGGGLLVLDSFNGELTELTYEEPYFRDVDANAWYAAAIDAAVRNGIAGGTGDGRFEPNGAMNRAMFVTMLSRLHQLTDGSAIIDGDASFTDVEADGWYAAPVRWAADRGIVRGENGSFAPLRSISREELAALLYRYAGDRGMNVSARADALSAFQDAGEVSPWAEEAMRWACAVGVLRGNDKGMLQPRAHATRAQALTMLLNFMNAYEL